MKQEGVRLRQRHEEPPAAASGYMALYRRLLCFSQNHPATPKHVQAVLIALSKGKHLVEAALAWEQPTAGLKSDSSVNMTCRARGEQWRLVMAYGGLETVVEALVPPQYHPFASYAEAAKHFTSCCVLPPYEPLPGPSQQRRELVKWLEAEEAFGDQPIASFLSLGNGDAKLFRRWVVEGRAIDAWHVAVQLAKALRNATAHGALSATKVRRWDLQPAFGILSDNLGTVVTAAVRRLVEQMPSPVLPSGVGG